MVQAAYSFHWLTGTNPHTALYRMWRDLGVLGDGVPVVHRESLYTLEEGGESLSLSRDLGKLEERLLSLLPEDGREIRSLRRAIPPVFFFYSIINPTRRKAMTRLPRDLTDLQMDQGGRRGTAIALPDGGGRDAHDRFEGAGKG